ncbi:MAG: ABC transporter ATP-binding protein [Lachnospiraceae bacterium]|nr:ABC transporter ATP-binding protein [Lachnospiraceae bacterium]
MLEMKNVSYAYRTKHNLVQVFENISFSFQKGKIYGIFGPSGSGKTTCLALLGGLESPDQGEVLLDNINIKEIGYRNLRKKYVSYIFQDYQLFPYMSALENVMVAAQISTPKNQLKHLKEKCTTELLNIGLESSQILRRVTELSGGQQQRVAIARALVTNADYILADEPTGNLDKETTKKIVELLQKIAHEQGKCVIVVTHSDYVRKNCDICYQIGGEDEK